MEKINVAELLKDCPKGMELDCTMYDNLYFDSVNADYYGTINCYTLIDGIKTSINFTKYGTFNNHPGAKCVIFPKSKTTWDGFVPPCKFKDGDILATDLGSVFFLNTRLNTDEYYGCFVGKGGDGSFHICEPFAYKECCGLATEEEKEKLFQAIKDKGYHWNAKTKTLDKLIEPQFKVGDKIRHKTNNKDDIYEISKVYDDSYGLVGFTWMLYMKHQDNWELVIEPKFKVGDEIVKRNSISNSWIVSSVSSEYYGLKLPEGVEGIGVLPISEQDNYELLSNTEKFDITTLKPFESKVLVRDKNSDKWIGQFFSHYDSGSDRPYVCIGIEGLCEYKKCIPFKNNEYLLGTTEDCNEYYKTWK